MNNEKMQMGQPLTQDEALVNDFIQTRLKKVLADIKELADTKSTDEMAWSAAFTYLSRTYGRSSEETFKWFKYYLRENMLPEALKLPLLIQIFMDATVDKGFVNILARIMKNQPEDVKNDRVSELKESLASFLDEEGMLTVYRGSFEKPFGTEDAASRTIDKAYTFTMDPEVAKHYAICWFPEKATIHTVKVAPEDIAWCSLYDEEKTVILLPQSKGASWQVTEEKEVEPGEYADMDTLRNARKAYMMNFKN